MQKMIHGRIEFCPSSDQHPNDVQLARGNGGGERGRPIGVLRIYIGTRIDEGRYKGGVASPQSGAKEGRDLRGGAAGDGAA